MKANFLKCKIFDKLDSTNCEAKRLALTNHPSIWILAKEQTQGRGRRGKKWHSLTKNFTASILLYPEIFPNQLSIYSYVAGIALYDTLLKFGIKSNQLILKWPNDLLLNNKKIGGILLESMSASLLQEKPLIIGFGVNLFSCPSSEILEDGACPTDCLKNNLSQVPDAHLFLNILVPIFEKWNRVFLKQGFKKIRKGFLERTFPVGMKIQVKTINRSVIGNFCGLNDDGSLLIDSLAGLINITAGDVVLIGK